MTAQKIALYGKFGVGNIGNECTLQALLANLQHRLPGATVYAICTAPDEVTKDYGIPAIPIGEAWDPPSDPVPVRRSFLARLLRLVFVRLPAELFSLGSMLKEMKGTTMVLVAGTGALEDDTGSLRWPYDMLKWMVVARLRGAKVGVVSIGAGPFQSRGARLIAKAILRTANYASYRDRLSKTYLDAIGLDTADHHIFPDLAFSLLPEHLPAVSQPPRTTVGLGIIGYRNLADPRVTDAGYRSYLDKTARLVSWLIGSGYNVRLIVGDLLYDRQPLADLTARLHQDGIAIGVGNAVSCTTIAGFDDLMRELAAVDLVIASRYHNLLLALLLGKPTISLSYHGKCNALLEDFDLGEFCQDFVDMDLEALKAQVTALTAQVPVRSRRISETVGQCRRRLEKQYDLLLANSVPASAAAQ